MLYTNTSQILYRKRISMLTGLTVSSFPCKRVFYRPEHNAKRNLILKVLKYKNEAHQQIELKE